MRYPPHKNFIVLWSTISNGIWSLSRTLMNCKRIPLPIEPNNQAIIFGSYLENIGIDEVFIFGSVIVVCVFFIGTP